MALDFISSELEWLTSRTQTITNAGKDAREKEPLYNMVGM
jgi:hypothetical protein